MSTENTIARLTSQNNNDETEAKIPTTKVTLLSERVVKITKRKEENDKKVDMISSLRKVLAEKEKIKS